MPRPSRKLNEEQVEKIRTNPPRVMNTAQAGAYLGMEARTIVELINKDRSFPAHRLTRKGEWRILLHELDEWMMSQCAYRN